MELYLYHLDDSRNKESSTNILSRVKIRDRIILKTYDVGNKSEELIRDILKATNRRLEDTNQNDKTAIVIIDGILFGYGILKE